MSALSSLLVQDQILTVTQIEQALQRQVIFGGDLATNLLELGLIGEDVLVEYLGRVVRQPVLPSGHLDNLDHRVIKMLPWNTVYERRVLPVRIHGNTLVVATAAPLAASVIDQIAKDLDIEIAPHIALEFRLGMALNRYYGIPLSARVAALQRRFVPDFEADQEPIVAPPDYERGTDPAVGGAAPVGQVEQSLIVNVGESQAPAPAAEPLLVVESSSVSRTPDVDSTMRFITGSGEQAPAKKKPTAAELAPVVEVVEGDKQPDARGVRGAAVQIKFSEASAMVEDARDRDEILDIFLNFAGQAFEFTALFVVQGKVAHGRAAMSRWSMPFGIEHLEIPLDQGGIFETVHQTRGFHLGPPSKLGADATVLHQLQRAHPKNCTLLPVLLRQRIILMLYGDSGVRGVRANRVARLADFARTVGSAFERILLKQKYGQYRKSVPTTPPKARVVEHPTVSMSPPARAPVEDAEAELWSKAREASEGKVPKADRDRFGVRDAEMIGAETWPEPTKASIPAAADEQSASAPADAGATGGSSTSEVDDHAEARSAEADEVDPHRDTLPASEAETQPIPRPTDKPDPVLVQRVEIVTVGESQVPKAEPPIGKPSREMVERVQVVTIQASSEPAVERGMPPGLASIDSRAPTDPPPPDGGFATQEIPSRAPESALLDEGIRPTADTVPADISEAQRDTLPPEADPPAEYEVVAAPSVQEEVEAAPPAPAEVEATPPQTDPSRSVVVDMTEEIERLIERVVARGRFDEEAAELLVGIGDEACAKLVEQFPGPLSYDRYQQTSRLRKVEQHGPLLRTLVMFGDRAVPFLLPLLDSLDSEIRFYATFLFTEIKHPDALGGLAQRIFDNDRQIRTLALDVLRTFDNFPEYNWTMKELAGTLVGASSTLETKRITAEALGDLRAPVAIKGLAEMLGSVDGVLAERCQRALVKITFNDFGFSERRWLNWADANRSRHRIEWAIESLNHRSEGIRQAAVEELRQMVSGSVKWPTGPLDHKQRRDLKQLCLEWWEREGRALHPAPELD